MNKLGEVLIAFRGVSLNTYYEDVCHITASKISCPFRGQYCKDCILDYRANFDKHINILNKLGE